MSSSCPFRLAPGSSALTLPLPLRRIVLGIAGPTPVLWHQQSQTRGCRSLQRSRPSSEQTTRRHQQGAPARWRFLQLCSKCARVFFPPLLPVSALLSLCDGYLLGDLPRQGQHTAEDCHCLRQGTLYHDPGGHAGSQQGPKQRTQAGWCCPGGPKTVVMGSNTALSCQPHGPATDCQGSLERICAELVPSPTRVC